MGKKHDRKKKTTKVVLSLAEFNEDAGLGGVDPELSALPSAPKAAEDWEAEGGRPEYNSRGYKERKNYPDRGYDGDADFDDRDWTRKGPLDAEEGNGFGAGGGDRDWGDMRRGPVDGPEGEGEGQPERNWNEMRRGPVESTFSGSQERDWGARKGPVEAELGNARVIDDSSWGGARKTTVDAEFAGGVAAAPADRDWKVRKGPVEAEGVATQHQEADWGAARKGPVESEFPGDGEGGERDWSQRKGPVEAEVTPGKGGEADWSDVRKGPVEADLPEKRPDVAERDWSARRGPVELEVEALQKGVRDVDFGDMRRGAKLQGMSDDREQGAEAKGGNKDQWRREPVAMAGRRGPVEARSSERPASTGHDFVSAKERDWGAARRSQPVDANPRNRQSGMRVRSVTMDDRDTLAQKSDDNGTEGEDSEWMKVESKSWRTAGDSSNERGGRGGPKSRNSARGGKGFTNSRRGLGGQSVGKLRSDGPARSPMSTEDRTTSSPVTPVASALSET